MIKNKDLIYKAFFNTKEPKLYYSQLKEITSLSFSSLQNVLKQLKENREIIEERSKSNTYYSLTNKCKTIEFTKIAQEKIDSLNLNVKIPLKEFLKLSPNELFTIIFFGSASIKQEQEGSDIDLLIVLHKFKNEKLQSLYETEIRSKFDKIQEEINSRSIYPLNLFITNKDEYLRNEDFVIKEASYKGFPVKNQLQFYENEN